MSPHVPRPLSLLIGATSLGVGEPLQIADRAAAGLRTLARTGLLRPVRPDRIMRASLASARFGATPASVAAAAAALHGGRPAVIDEFGTLTFSELDLQSRAVAAAMHDHFDLGCGARVAIMCRNHRGFVQAVLAATRLGCDVVPLNSDFAGPQLADVLAREGITAAVHDEEFGRLFDAATFERTRIVAWHDAPAGGPTLETLIELGLGHEAPPPRDHGRLVLLTSGTTGTPKGATRNIRARSLAPLAAAGLLDLGRIKQVPRSGDPFIVGPPLFHLYGMIALAAAFGFGSPIVVRRRFDPETTLDQIERTRAGVLLVVPTMLGRIMSLPEDTRARYDTSSLRMVVSGAAPLAPELALAAMDEFGDVLYNGYASTEVGAGTLATPTDLRAAPGTVGRPSSGIRIKILDDEGLERSRGEIGRIFVGSPLLFDGYTGGGGKEVIDGMMSTGDVGHFDEHRRLFIDGRDDDMILSGGENVFPQEIEDLLSAHEQIADAAVFGVPDEDFGQRLAALIVLNTDATVSEEELRAYVREHLARHKVPREFTFVEELPRTTTGKLQRHRLGELHAT